MNEETFRGFKIGILFAFLVFLSGMASVCSMIVSNSVAKDTKNIGIVVNNQETRLKTIEMILTKAIQESQKTVITTPKETPVISTPKKEEVKKETIVPFVPTAKK